MLVSRGRMFHSTRNKRKKRKGKKKASRNHGGWGLLPDALFDENRHGFWSGEGGQSVCCLKRKPPRRPVKIALSVYCLFDPVGRTAESRRGEAKRIAVPTWEKLPHELFSVFSERLPSGALVSFHPLINRRAEKRPVRSRHIKGKLGRGRRDAARKRMLQGSTSCWHCCGQNTHHPSCEVSQTETLRVSRDVLKVFLSLREIVNFAELIHFSFIIMENVWGSG